MGRHLALPLLLAGSLLGGCASSFPPRAADVDMANEPALCPDFRAIDMRVAVDVFDPLAQARPSAQETLLGCATARSLRVMVADPADLGAGTTGPARGPTPSTAVDRYAVDARKPLPELTTLTADGTE